MIKNVIVPFLGIVTDGLELDDNDFNSLNFHFTKTGEHFHCVDHVSDTLQTLAESVKLAKNVVLTEEYNNKQSGYTFRMLAECVNLSK